MAADRAAGQVRGVIVLSAGAGRALRGARRLPVRGDVLGCSGDFDPGDRVCVTMRGHDGGQAVVALAISAIQAATLRSPAPMRFGERDDLVLAADGLDVLWANAP